MADFSPVPLLRLRWILQTSVHCTIKCVPSRGRVLKPDVSGATVELGVRFASAKFLNCILNAPNNQLPLPKTWTTADFTSHKLEVPLLAYGKKFSDVMLRLTYKNGAKTLAEEKIKVRVRPPTDLTGLDTGAQFPFFRVLRTTNLGAPIKSAIDPALNKERLNKKAAVYLVAHKSLAQWAADPTLTDVRGAPTPVTVQATSIKDNITLIGTAPIPGAYDVVYDFGNFPDDPANFTTDGKLDPGDILDNGGVDQPSIMVEDSLTAAGPKAVAPAATYNFASAVPVSAMYDGLAIATNFRLRGQVIYPSGLTGPAPLLVIAHGRHLPKMCDLGAGFVTIDSNCTSDENYKGYTYLQQHMTSRGFITLSVDLDEAFSGYGYPAISTAGIKIRAWLILKNIEKLISDDTIAGGDLFSNVSGVKVSKIDISRIYLVGHSRGGEAVIVAYHLLKKPTDAPGGASPAGFTASGIKGIVSISPVTQAIEAGGITPQEVPYLLLYGSADGDVNGAIPGVEPFRHYDRAVKDKFAVRIIGANHNYFCTSWPTSDANQATGCPFSGTVTAMPPVGAGLLTPTQQQNIAKGYVAAFLGMIDSGDVAASNYFLEQPSHLRPLGIDPTIPMYSQARLRHRDKAGGG